MTSNAWHEGVKHTSREQSLSSQQNIHRQGGEPGFNSDCDFDSAWQALRNLTEGSLANPTSQESTQLTNSDLQVGGNNKPTAFEPHKNENTTYVKPEIKKAVSFSPSMEAQNKLNPGPSLQQISPQSPLPQPKSSWRQKHLSGMMLCGVYVAMGYLGAGLIDRINEFCIPRNVPPFSYRLTLLIPVVSSFFKHRKSTFFLGINKRFEKAIYSFNF